MANKLKSCPGDKAEKLLCIAKIIMQDINKAEKMQTESLGKD
jgi:hypothetical protein